MHVRSDPGHLCLIPSLPHFPLPPRYDVPAGDPWPTEGLQAKDLLSRPPFLSLVALIAILDPPRDEAIAAVKVAHKAGIQVKMITGIH
jgi:hypothetical protein